MKICSSCPLRLLALGAVVFTLNLRADDTASEHLSLDANWKFHLGDDWPEALNLDKAGRSGGPAAERFNDTAWRSVDLPHDWAIELPFDKNADGNHGFKPVGPGFPRNSIGWYRRTFELPKEDAGRRIWLQFDGVFRDATVWVNGWFVAHHEGGYNLFREDITDILHYGGKNLITVKVDASKFEGWFYEGAGIYRHVWLDKTAPVAIAPDGVFVYSQFKNNVPDGKAEIYIQTRLKNSKTNSVSFPVTFIIYRPGAITLANMLEKFQTTVTVAASSEIEITNETTIPDYELWSPESPKLYSLITLVSDLSTAEAKPFDIQKTLFGIRTFAFDKDRGFLLNGKPYELYGTCNHQDMAGVGAALPDALQYFRIARLKEFGCNAYRTSHNPPTPELLDACDRLGMIVMDENRLLGSDSANLEKWRTQILRDRNHASVGIWSICNEESLERTPEAGRVGATMQNLVKQLDPTRPVTCAEDVGNEYSGLMSTLEVRGWNYHIGKDMDDYHAEHPDQPNVGTEQGSTVSTRGIYANDRQRGYVSAYDDNAPPWAHTAERWWSYFADRPWLSGGFIWTGFDYRGEPTPYGWPCINSHFGVLDTCGFPKDNFYYYQSWWTTNLVLHLLPHWNWPGREGQEIRVDALSNCKQVELFLNGASLGKQTMKPNSHLTWMVKYAPGTLSAKGFDAAGNVIAETKVETTGDATQIQLTPDRSTINADGADVSVFTVSIADAQGRLVPTAGNKISFALEGAGKILGVGNGDPSCHEPDVFNANLPVHTLAVHNWRWQRAAFSTRRGAATPEFAPEFDDSAWNTLQASTDGDNDGMFLKEGETAIYRAHLKLTEDDLNGSGAQIRFPCIDDHGWVYVNNQLVGESHDWAAQPAFDLKKSLHAGDNVIAVGVKNDAGAGGLNPKVNVEMVGKPTATPWSRSVFNGLAEVIVQAGKEAGALTLTATAEGLKPATVTVQAQACAPRPSMP